MTPKLRTFKKNINSPKFWIFDVPGWMGRKYLKFRWDLKGRMDISSADWDNLIILDACRYDMFEELNTINGELHSAISMGSSSSEFLRENFANKSLHDTVYVTANPHYELIGLEDVFHDTIDVWEFGWDSDLRTVPPEVMVKATKEANSKYPNKRILSHFMQPHVPFLGDSAKNVGDHAGFEHSVREAKTGCGSRDTPHVWELLKTGQVSKSDVWKAYMENLELVLPHIETVMKELGYKTVITSDHGNLVGEFVVPFPRRKYGHPSGFHANQLVKVPWFVTGTGERKDVVSDPPVKDNSNISNEMLEDRLGDLGYLQN